MGSHFIHYIVRKVKTDKAKNDDPFWYVQPQKITEGFAHPAYHITRRKTGPSANIKPGDTIWLVGQLISPWGKLPPSLDAKIVVQKVLTLPDGRTRFTAGAASRWFPLADVSQVLKKLTTVSADENTKPLLGNLNKPVGLYLRAIRKLNHAQSLLAWEQQVKNNGYHFISYRIKDGTKAAFEKTKKLLEKKQVVFWDRWSLPRRLTERRELVSNTALNNHLLKMIEASKITWGIETRLYREQGSYAQKESLLAKKAGKYKAVKPVHNKTNKTL